MSKQTRYYLGRVLKRGELSSARVIEAMRSPVTIEYRGTRYSFIDFERFDINGEQVGYVAKIAKYRQQGAVEVVHEAHHASAEAAVVNLIDATSAFVYLPEVSGIAYRHIWNTFPREQFERVFKELVELKHNKFFVAVDIEPIADLRTFVSRLAKLDRMTHLAATVVPPNPLFGPCWKSLAEYLRKRNLEEATINEQSAMGIESNISQIATAVLDETDPASMVELMEPLLDGVGDAALLMAADGYGHARVEGTEGDRKVVIRTSENQKSFLIDSGSGSAVLYERSAEIFRLHTEERGLEHP